MQLPPLIEGSYANTAPLMNQQFEQSFYDGSFGGMYKYD